MNQTGRLTTLILLLAFATSCLAQSQPSRRISEAQESFQLTLLSKPEEKVNAALFFSESMFLVRLKEVLAHTTLEIRAFRHGTQSYSGGYTFSAGESVEQAIANYSRDHSLFLQKRLELEDRMATTAQNYIESAAFESHRREAEQMQADYQANGIRVIGIEVAGAAKDIAAFQQENAFVRVIELTYRGVPQPAMIPGK